MDTRRRNHLLIVGGLAALTLLSALGLSVMEASRGWAPVVTGPVLADWALAADQANTIEVVNAEDHFSLVRDGARWVMPERDSYPVRPEQVAGLDELLSGLVYLGARTADPDKHARLGLAEPGLDGGGVRITVRDAEGAVLADWIFGEVRGGALYLRHPDEDRTYAARVPEGTDAALLSRPADQWLDLDFIELGRSAIARVTIQPEDGRTYVLERPASVTRNFALRSPAGWQPITAGAGNGPAAVLARLRFRDVRRIDRLTGAVVGYHEAETFEGLRIRIDVIAQGETRWARVTASALTDDALENARALQARTEGWAYLLSDLSLDRLMRPLSEIADPREEAGDAP